MLIKKTSSLLFFYPFMVINVTVKDIEQAKTNARMAVKYKRKRKKKSKMTDKMQFRW